MAWLRRAGRGRLADGGVGAWSVAEGRHGRRWRWTVTDPTGPPAGLPRLRHAGLIELDPAGGFARLEIESAEGMLTFHPDPEGVGAHGNVVRPDGVTPVACGWTAGDAVRLIADAFGTAVAGWRGRGVVVTTELELAVGRSGSGRDPDAGEALALDDRGVPVLGDAVDWALEV